MRLFLPALSFMGEPVVPQKYILFPAQGVSTTAILFRNLRSGALTNEETF